MKDIGSIFPLYDDDFEINIVDDKQQAESDTILYSLCREALYVIADCFPKDKRKVLLPAYTCSTVVTPFVQVGWECSYYSVDKSLRIDVNEVKSIYYKNHNSLILVHPYFGMDLNDDEIQLLEELHNDGCKVVVDLTQCIFSNKDYGFADYIVGSYRKWYEVPDGGFLKPRIQDESFKAMLPENKDFVSLQADSMYLRGLYFNTNNEVVKNISRRLNKLAVNLGRKTIEPHAMSAFSISLMNKVDKQKCQQQRFENYQFLFQNLKHYGYFQLACTNLEEVTTSPLYFVIYVQDRLVLQASLAAEHIYAPIIWPIPNEDVLINETVQSIYDTVLAIPVDQRYDLTDMAKIVETINNHYHDKNCSYRS